MKYKILHKYNWIFKPFNDAGVPVVLVGGSVRDAILGRPVTDIDMATPMQPEEVMDRMKGYKIIPSGIDHGTIKVMLDRTEVEVTTYRVDKACDGRHADVEFTGSLEDDLARRDFTINAMAWDGTQLIDPYGGEDDCKWKMLRAVGNPKRRFREDYLRPIRGFRFAAILDFDIVAPTFTAAFEVDPASQIGTGQTVSFERVITEFDKVFKIADSASCEQFITYMYELGVLSKLFPELDLGPKPCHELAQSPVHHPEGDVLTHIAKATGHAKGVEGRWIALMHDVAKPITAEWDPKGIGNQWYSFYGHDKVGAEMIKTKIKDRLPLSNELVKKAALCARWHLYIFLAQKDKDGNPLPPSGKQIRKVQAAMKEHLPLLRALGHADHMGRTVHPYVEKYFEEQDIPVEPILLGRHLKEDGWEPGPHFGPALKAAEKAQIDEGITDLAKLLEVANENNSSS